MTSCVRTSCVSKLCVDKMCEDKVYVSKLCVDKLCVSKLCDDKLCVWASCVMTSCVCVSKLCVDKLCVSNLWDDKLCVSKVVWASCEWDDGRRREEEAGGGRTAEYRTKNKNPTQRCGEWRGTCQRDEVTRNWGKVQLLSDWNAIAVWLHAVKWLQITQVPKSHPTETCHIKAAGLRCQVVIWRRNQNRIQHKHVTSVTSKQPAYDAKCHLLFECDANISCLSAMQSRAMFCHITSPHSVLKLSDVMWCLLAPSGGVIAVWLHGLEMWCDVWWLWCHCCLTEMATDDADTKIASIQTETCHSVCKSASATADTAQCHACHACHAKWRWMSPSATPATQSAPTCLQVLCLPLKVQLHVAKCHACHAKRRGATAPHLQPSAPPEPAQCHKCHACHAKCSYMSPSAVPATQSAATCRQVPRLSRKTPRRHGATPKAKRATRASPMPCVPRLPRKVTVDVTKCHACDAKWWWISPRAKRHT